MAPQSIATTRKPSFRRAFLPFWIALVWAAVILVRDYHIRHSARTRISLQVTVEGTEPDEGFTVEVDNRFQRLHVPVPIGFRKIRIYAPDTESETIKHFI